MIQFGFTARKYLAYPENALFARKNNFDFMQLWYDSNGLEVKVKEVLEENIPTIIHAVLNIDEISIHAEKLQNILTELNHQSLIIHPKYDGEQSGVKLNKLFNNELKNLDRLLNLGIEIFLENNSKISPLFYKPEDIKFVFQNNPKLELLLDIAHIDSYNHLAELIKIKMPKILHLADKHFSIDHEHIPVSKGELDFQKIFQKYLTDFSGKIVFEIDQSDEDLIESKNIIKNIINKIHNYT